MNGCAWIRIDGRMTTAQLTQAAARIVAEHPLLRVRIEARADGTRPRFVAATDPRVGIRTVRAAAGDETAAAAEVDAVELREPLDWRTGPLVRLVDIVHGEGTADESHELILTIAHVIADALSMVSLLGQVVRYAAEQAPDPATIRSRPPLRPADELIPRGSRSLTRAVLALILDQAVSVLSRPVLLPPEADVPPAQRRSRLICREFSTKESSELIALCKSRGVTVHGVLTAAMATAVAHEITPNSSRRVPIGSPVNCRGELEPPIGLEELGPYASSVSGYLLAGPNIDLWTTAHRSNRIVRQRLRLRQHLSGLASWRLVTPKSVAKSGFIVNLVNQRAARTVLVSNIGLSAFPDRAGDWRLSGLQGAVGVSCVSYMVAGAVTSGGVLRWNFTFAEGVLSAARAHRIADHAVEVLRAQLVSH
ncbi:hypothetical protein AB0I30_09945 [Nocardia tengchongensis]|uniref:phthiocerol/phthiodiolone dimycocerosyl transferase family protein n=1 Tax=Nocardia tengchongensis TaxID=2055889 RepID=UPI0034007EC2